MSVLPPLDFLMKTFDLLFIIRILTQSKTSQKHIILMVLCNAFSFNKKEEDFPSLRDYNDYLEEVETISECTGKGTSRSQHKQPLNISQFS